MIICTTKPEVEKEVVYDDMGIRSWKTTYSILKWLNEDKQVFVLFDATKSVKYEKSGAPDKWQDLYCGGFMLTISKWQWGEDHLWYDCSHCARHFGWLHFYWTNDDCQKCADA